jgi:hypothetical protein
VAEAEEQRGNRSENIGIVRLYDTAQAHEELLRRPQKFQANGDPSPETFEKEPTPAPDYFCFIEDGEDNCSEEVSTNSSTEFRKTPLQDLLSLAPQELIRLVLDPSTSSFSHS